MKPASLDLFAPRAPQPSPTAVAPPVRPQHESADLTRAAERWDAAPPVPAPPAATDDPNRCPSCGATLVFLVLPPSTIDVWPGMPKKRGCPRCLDLVEVDPVRGLYQRRNP